MFIKVVEISPVILNHRGTKIYKKFNSDRGKIKMPELEPMYMNEYFSKMSFFKPPDTKSKRKKSNTADENFKTLDSSQQMANIWRIKLSKMNRIQRIIAEKVINEVMFNAELGLLNYNTSLCHIGVATNAMVTLPAPVEQEPKHYY